MAAPSTSRPPLREITTPNARPLAPIFTLYKRRTVAASSSSPPECFQLRTPPSSSPLKHIGTRKRLRVREDSDDDEDVMSKVVVSSLSLGKRTARARREAEKSVEMAKRVVDENPFVETAKDAPGVARRSRRRTIAFEAVTTHEFSQGLATGNRSLSYRTMHAPDAYLSTLTRSVTSPHSFLRFPSFRSPNGQERDFAPPLCSAMSWSAKHLPQRTDASGPKRLLAVGNEEGFVTVVDVDRELFHDEEAECLQVGGMGYGLTGASPLFDLHKSSVFDVKWSGDDKRLLTMSADTTSNLHDISGSTPRLLATLQGHTSSIKSGVFFDPSRSSAYDPASMPSTVIATGGRDGNILIYDLRCKGWALPDGVRTRNGTAEAGDSHSIFPVATIRNAHGQIGKRATAARTAIRSVTSLLALDGMPGTLASGGSFDGIVKLWDVRFPSATSSRSVATSGKPPSTTAVFSLPDPTLRFSKRHRAILSLNEDPTTGDIYAFAAGARIHALSPSTGTCYTQTYSHSELLGDSFYMKSSLSPDGRYLAAGTVRGGLVTWDVAKGKAGGDVKGTYYEAGNRACDVTSIAWGQDVLATCSDDMLTKLWRPNPDASRILREDPQAASYKWQGPRL